MTLVFSENDTVEGEARQLARHYPNGRIWANKFNVDSTLGKLILGLSEEWLRAKRATKELSDELDINQSIDLLERWEESVGIPDDCFTGEEDIPTRRLQVIQKLTDYGGVQTDQDFIDVAALFGFTISIERVGSDSVFPLPFPLNFFGGTGKSARHTVYVRLPNTEYVFPLPFPLNFAGSSGVVLECIFRELAPANTDIIFIFEGP